MSEKEIIELSDKLNKALKESYYKMLDLKKKLGQTVIISDGHGKPLEVTPEEAEMMAKAKS
ncbi:MAG: hypothetical protein HDS39_02560 [Bacteroides sp.]|nr:hypothetical protein [Bacteroides sp.]